MISYCASIVMNLIIIFFLVLVLPTVEHVGIVGDRAIFNCLPRSNVLISGVRWTVNGSLLEAQDLPNVVAEFSPIGNGLGTLLVSDLSELFNNTLIGCIATVDSVEISSSNEPILLVQGMWYRSYCGMLIAMHQTV